MGFYDLSKAGRVKKTEEIYLRISSAINEMNESEVFDLFSDPDTYIRKACYEAVGKIYLKEKSKTEKITTFLEHLFSSQNELVRQTVVNAAGEIAKYDFESVRGFFDAGILDTHHKVRNAVIGSIKKAGQKNPGALIRWSEKHLSHPDKEVRRQICHGIELRGRTHPEEILPLLRALQNDSTARVRNTLIHVLGQIAYKEGCLEKVLNDLSTWENKVVVEKALLEIEDVHHRYSDFAHYGVKEAEKIISGARKKIFSF